MSAARRYEKPDALSSITNGPHDVQHHVIEASAGTGKTYTLEHLIVELLLVRKIPIEQILVVTFTEKATGELVSRVRKKLEELRSGDFREADENRPSWLIDDEARGLLERALFAFDTASISTIHSFCQRVLTEHAFAHRRLFDQEAVDENTVFEGAFKDVLRRDLSRDPALASYLSAWLSRGSVTSLEELLRACSRARGTLMPAYDPERLRIAIENLPAVDESVYAALEAVHHSTRKKMKAVLAKLESAIAKARADGDAAAFLVEAESLDLNYMREKFESVPELISAVGSAGAFRSAFLELADSAVGLDVAVAQLFLGRVAERARALKEAAGQFDFQDMLSLVAESLAGPHGVELAATLRRRYRAALIDEFQDTDDVQWSIFRRIFVDELPARASNPPSSTLFVIGDPKQAIYGFRGADVHTYFAARDLLGEPLPLTQNFRSTPLLVAAYNAILSQAAAEPFFDGKIVYDHPVTAGKDHLVAVDKDGRALTPIHLLCPTSDTGKLSAHVVKHALSHRIAKEIRALLDEKTPTLRFGEAGDEKPIKAGDIYVLTRTRSEGDLIGEHLRALGIPHAFYKQDGLFERPEAAHVLDLLRSICDPHNLALRFRAWLTPFFALTLRDLDSLRELPGTDELVQRIFDWKALADERDFARLFSNIVQQSGIVRRELFLSESERELTNYLHLFEILVEEAGRGHGTLDDLARTLGQFIAGTERPEGESGDVQRLESDRNAVQIMTIHKSKGLEASVCFVFGGFSPNRSSSVHVFHDQDDRRIAWVGSSTGAVAEAIKREVREEDQRLLYVAMTRAKARLYLPYFRLLDEVDFKSKAKGKVKQVEEFKSLGGCYRQLNDRLRVVMEDFEDEAGRALFSVEEFPARPVAIGEEDAQGRLLGWRVPAEVLDDESAAYQATKERHAGFVVTSYTGLKRGSGGYRAPSGDKDDDHDSDATDRLPLPEVDDPNALPGGKNSGNFLHAVLEEMPLESFESPPLSVEEWSGLGDVRKVFARNAGQFGIEPRHLPHARRLVHTALTTNVQLHGGAIMPGFCSAAPRITREMEFLYPIPERDHPRLSQAVARGGFQIGRGYIRGYVDVIFEHAGLTYLADWKSDSLPRWDAALVDKHVAANYGLQARFYTLALVKMLDVHDEADYARRFGGYVYCFLRGMRASSSTTRSDEGMYFRRPAWAEILAWEEELLRDDLLAQEARP